MKELENKIFHIQNKEDFHSTAMEVFRFQYDNCAIYREFVDATGRKEPKTVEEIPFLPISFFKTHEVRCLHQQEATLFMSSGTTGMERSKHYVESIELYESSFLRTYATQIGNPEDQIILALLPNYIDQGNSSLVYMVDRLVKESKHPASGFYLDSLEEIIATYEKYRDSDKQLVLFGVSYALLDLAELKPNLSKMTIIETGGMKGRRKELTKEELHRELMDAFQVPYISSEYGMSELLSQGYSDQAGIFTSPPWMDIRIREVNDPFHYLEDGRTGGINVIDLANLYSCSFIATQDLGKKEDKHFQLMGRFDHSDIRGCNLMVE